MTGAASAAVCTAPIVLAATVPTPRNGHAISPPITTQAATVTVVGGTGPYTYAWSRAADGDGTWTINSPTSVTTTFTCTDTGGLDLSSAFFVCTVTDSLSVSAVSNALTAVATEAA